MNCIKDGKYTGDSCLGCPVNVDECEIRDKVYRKRWIPVEERLPKKPEENPMFENKPLELYLVSVKNTDYAFRAFWNGISFTDGWSKLDVVAWMPLPEPFNPQN